METKIALVEQQMKNIEKEIKSMDHKMDEGFYSLEKKFDGLCDQMKEEYVSNDRFKPVEKLVYGVAGAILMAVLGATLGLVIL